MAKPLTITIPHSLGALEAKRRIDEGLTRLIGQVGANAKVSREWQGERLLFAAQALGQTISGHMDVAAEEVRMEIQLPNFLAMMAGKIRGKVETQGRLLLENKKRP